jgi:hypothetical protein
MKPIQEYGLTAPLASFSAFHEMSLYFCMAGTPSIAVDFSDHELTGDYEVTMGYAPERNLNELVSAFFVDLAEELLKGLELNYDSEDTGLSGKVIFNFATQQVVIKYGCSYVDYEAFSESRSLDGRFDETVRGPLLALGVVAIHAEVSGSGDSGDVNSSEARNGNGDAVELPDWLSAEVGVWADAAFGRVNADISNNGGGSAEISLNLATLLEEVEGQQADDCSQQQEDIVLTDKFMPALQTCLNGGTQLAIA